MLPLTSSAAENEPKNQCAASGIRVAFQKSFSHFIKNLINLINQFQSQSLTLFKFEKT